VTMKAPSLGARDKQTMSDGGINPFAVELVAESFADKPEKFGDRTIMLIAHAHAGTPVYMLISTQRPDPEQFSTWPKSDDDEVPVDGR
jgi:hypothetical protein